MDQNPVPGSMSRVYADANERLGESWYNYDDLQIGWGEQEEYEIIRKVGRGRYSEVFEGVHLPTDSRCVIKVLKPVKRKKIKREIKILQNLRGGTNIISILDIVRDPVSKTPALVTEYIDNTDSKQLYPTFTDHDIRYYIFELLKALDFCHSRGIIHRDVKPLNILIDHDKRQLRLIDWGLAEFYHPGVELNVRVASRYYKAPELLVDDVDYDFSLDLWSVGCTLGSMLLRKDPLFHGHDNVDQLIKIVKILGTDDLFVALEKYQLDLPTEYDDLIKTRVPKRPWSKFVNADNQRLVSQSAFDLLEGLLKYDRGLRLTAKEAMQMSYFDEVRRQDALRKAEHVLEQASFGATGPSTSTLEEA